MLYIQCTADDVRFLTEGDGDDGEEGDGDGDGDGDGSLDGECCRARPAFRRREAYAVGMQEYRVMGRGLELPSAV
eukprot:COSAG02_NODE_53204_length_303_cov_0.764706_1_plen_75_part_00